MSIDIKSILERNGVDLPIQENDVVRIVIDYCILADNKLQYKVNEIHKYTDKYYNTRERVEELPILDEAFLKSKIAELELKPGSTMLLALMFDSNNVARCYGCAINKKDPADEILYKIREENHNESCSSGQILSEPFPKPFSPVVPMASQMVQEPIIEKPDSPDGIPVEVQAVSVPPVAPIASPVVPMASQLVQEPIIEKPDSPNVIPVEVQAVSEGNIVPPVPVPPVPVPTQVAPERRIPQNDILVSKDDSAISSHKASPTTAAGDLIRTSVQPFVPPPPIQAFTEESQAQVQVPEEAKEDVLDPKEDRTDALEDAMVEIPFDKNEKKQLTQNEERILTIIDHMINILSGMSSVNNRRLVNPGEIIALNYVYKELIRNIDDILLTPPPDIQEPKNHIQRNNFYRFTSQWPFIKNRLNDINDNLVIHNWDYYYSFTNKVMTYLKELLKIKEILKLYLFGQPDEDYVGGKAATSNKKKRRTKRGHNKNARKSKTQRKR
jgi:hypothetical protein